MWDIGPCNGTVARGEVGEREGLSVTDPEAFLNVFQMFTNQRGGGHVERREFCYKRLSQKGHVLIIAC